MNTYAKHIERAIEVTGGTQEALAEALGVSQTTVSKWLNGRARPSIAHAMRLEQATDGYIKAAEIRPEIAGYLSGRSEYSLAG